MPLLDYFELDSDAVTYVQGEQRLDGSAAWTHMLTLPQAQHDLSDALSHYQIAGRDRQQVIDILDQVARHLKYMNDECGFIHGDLVR